jgi:hypothetical protein
MDQHSDNPPENKLPPGVDESKLVDAVRASGYPLQAVVARALGSKFHVIEEWGYTDRTEKTHRSLDVYAIRELDAQTASVKPRLHMLVECKRSDLPYVFFEPGVERSPRDFPEIIGTSGYQLRVAKGVQEASPAEFFCARELPFISPGPTIATSYSKADPKGDKKKFDLSGAVPFNQVVLPLASAVEQLRAVFGRGSSDTPMITLGLCVVDAAMIVARGTPETPQLRAEPWVRVIHQEAVQDVHHWRWRHYTVDFVHRAYLSKYVDDHVLVFAEELATRIVKYRSIAGKEAAVRNKEFSWSQFLQGR